MAVVWLDAGGVDNKVPLNCRSCRSAAFHEFEGVACCSNCRTMSFFKMDGTPVAVSDDDFWQQKTDRMASVTCMSCGKVVTNIFDERVNAEYTNRVWRCTCGSGAIQATFKLYKPPGKAAPEKSPWEKRVMLLMGEDTAPPKPEGTVSAILAEFNPPGVDPILLNCPICNKPATDGFADDVDSTYYIACSDDACRLGRENVMFFDFKSWNRVAEVMRKRFGPHIANLRKAIT